MEIWDWGLGNSYIFINGNFTECISKDSIELEFYYINDNIIYFSWRDIKYKNNKKYQELLKIPIPEISITIPKFTEITYIIKTTISTTS